MTTGLLAASGPDDRPLVDRRLTVELRAQDRPDTLPPSDRMPAVMVGVLAASALVHAVIVLTAFVGTRVPRTTSHEIAVEIVQEPPPAPKPRAVPKAPALPPKPDAAPQPADNKAKLQSMQKEIENLRAEQEALKTQLAAESKAPAPSAASGRDLVFPSIAENGDGDAVGFQQLVFSALAKAKGDGEYRGKAGVTGIRFELGAAGDLLRVEVTRSSGDRELDDRAVDIVRRAAPFPPPPTEADRTVIANVNFRPPKR